MSELIQLFNVGKVLEQHLLSVGIETVFQLKETGAEQAFLLIRDQRDRGACLHMLYGLRGAILGIPDSQLSEEEKTHLKQFYRSLCD
ncbi:MAG: competence protein TfoX [Spirochaetia bacterium]|nr:competence protein TfoX [Spirochaetia bacterium]